MLAGAGGRFAKPPPILLTTATTGGGVVALVDAIEDDRERAHSPDEARIRASNQLLRAVTERARRRSEELPQWDAMVEQIAKRQVDPITAADRLLDR
jgi:putative protein kinase ArgK-like GTPase of G3E family